MTRTTRLKVLYLVVLMALAALAYGVVTRAFAGRETLGALVVGLALLVPGRIQGVFYRELFRGRRLLDAGRADDALTHLHAFIASLQAQPWRKRLLWLAWTIYTTDAEAMAWQNVGVAHLTSGRPDDAGAAFLRALELDPAYPLPHVGLAQRAVQTRDLAAVQAHVDAARALGFPDDALDALVRAAQATLARVEGG